MGIVIHRFRMKLDYTNVHVQLHHCLALPNFTEMEMRCNLQYLEELDGRRRLLKTVLPRLFQCYLC